MIKSFDGKTPKIDASVFVSEMATIIGDVEMGENSSAWPGAVIRADMGKITIGRNSHVEDASVVHSKGNLVIGDYVLIGHGVVVHCAKIGNNVLVGNNATLLNGADIGDYCIIAANSLLSVGQKIPGGSLVVGAPARVKRTLNAQERQRVQNSPALYTAMSKRAKEQGL